MPLPGVRTILKDRFYTLTRTDTPAGAIVIGLARRNADTDYGEITDHEGDFASLEAWANDSGGGNLGASEDGDVYRTNDGSLYRWEWNSTSSTGVFVAVPAVSPNERPVLPRSEETVIRNFGEDSELHRCYVEIMQGGASRAYLLPIGADVTDNNLANGDNLERWFENAEVVRPDIVVLWGRGGYHDDGAPVGFTARAPIVNKAAEMCKTITDRSNPCFAVVGVDPANGVDKLVGSEVGTHTEFELVPTRGDVVDGQYVSVIGTEVKLAEYPTDWGWSNGTAAYAGLIAALPAENGTTGKRLPGVVDLRYSLTRPQQAAVAAQGIVPVSYDSIGRVRVIDGVTFGSPPSDYTRLSTLRIIFDAVQLVRAATEPYVGQPATLQNRNSMETAISSALRNMQLVGSLIMSDFVVSYLPRENKAVIDLVVMPAFEMRNIEVSVSIQL